MMNDQNHPSGRIVRFLISISVAGIVFAALASRLPWDHLVIHAASR
jgi:hypothetical protein